jgi:hypothetical protein
MQMTASLDYAVGLVKFGADLWESSTSFFSSPRWFFTRERMADISAALSHYLPQVIPGTHSYINVPEHNGTNSMIYLRAIGTYLFCAALKGTSSVQSRTVPMQW